MFYKVAGGKYVVDKIIIETVFRYIIMRKKIEHVLNVSVLLFSFILFTIQMRLSKNNHDEAININIFSTGHINIYINRIRLYHLWNQENHWVRLEWSEIIIIILCWKINEKIYDTVIVSSFCEPFQALKKLA